MELQPSYSFFPLGDAAVLMDCGAVMDPSINAFVIQCFQQLQAARLSFITDLVPAYASLTIHYNTPMVRAGKIEEESCYEAVTREIERLLQHSIVQSSERRLLRIPVCYNEALGPDLAELAKAKGLTTDDVIRIHTSRTYRVYMLGFLPGFAYMGEVAPDIAMPRHAQPRREVPAGSVGIAGEQTGIYPLASPGGWQLIGSTPMTLFEAQKEQPVLLQPGDTIQFYSITPHEFADYQGRIA